MSFKNTKQLLRYKPTDSSTNIASFEIVTSTCFSYFGATGGFPSYKIKVPTLKIVHPNGGEVFVAGSDTLITWEGVSPSDNVALDYSFNGGYSWNNITKSGKDLKHVWKPIPLPTSNTCLMRVQQKSNFFDEDSILTLTGHSLDVLGVAFSPDGLNVVTASWDDTVRIWDAYSRKLLRKLSGHTDQVTCVAYSSDGSRFVTGSHDRSIKIWDAKTGALISSFEFPPSNDGRVLCVAFSPDGNSIAVGGWSNEAYLLDAKTGVILQTLKGHTSNINDINFNFNGTRVLTASKDMSSIIWFASTGAIIHQLKVDSVVNSTYIYGNVIGAKFSPDGNKVIMSTAGGYLLIRDAYTGSPIRTLLGHPPKNTINDAFDIGAFALTTDGNQVVVATTQTLGPIQNIKYLYSAKIIDVNIGKVIKSLDGHTNRIWSVGFNFEGNRVLTGSRDFTAKIWDIDFAIIQQDISDSLFSIIAPQPVLKVISVDMGQVLVGDDKDSTVTALLCNVGAAPLHVLGIDVTAGDTSDFMIPRGAGDFYLAPNECRDVMFEFMATKVGARRATATIRTTIGDFKDTVEILGEGVAPSLSIISSLIDFGKVTVGTNKDSSKVTTVKNIGSTPIAITQITYNTINTKDFSTLVGGNPLVLQPNEEAIMDLRFLPTDEGRTSGLLEFHYNGIGSPAMVQLFGEGIKRGAKIAAAGLVVPPFACEVDKIDTLRIRNQGTDTLKINSASIGGMNPADFQFVTPFSPSIVLPDSTLLLPVKFAPTSAGTRLAVLELRSNSLTDSILTLSLSGRKDVATFSTNTQVLDLGTLCPNQTKDTILTLTNTGTVDNTLRIQTTNLILGSTSVYLSTSQNKLLTVRLTGQATEGAINEVITITDTICGTKLNIQVVGNIKLPTIASQRVADFGSVAVGASTILDVTTVNTGTRPIVVIPPQGVTLPFTLISLTPPAGSILAPNDTLKARVRFDAVSELQSTGRVDWSFTQPCSIKDSTELRGLGVRSDTARTTIIAEDITAQAGEKVHLILKLQKSTGMQIVGAPTDWYASIHYNKSILFNEQTQNVCTGTEDSCVLELSGKYNPQTDELISIPCVATLGSTDYSMISIDNFRWLNSSIVTETQTQNGTITITGTCEQGGVRLLIPSTTVTSLTTRPNPAQNSLQVQYGLREPLTVTLELLNMTGQVVQTIFRDQQKTEGQYLLTSDLSTIGNGVYILRLTTNRGVLTTRVDVVK